MTQQTQHPHPQPQQNLFAPAPAVDAIESLLDFPQPTPEADRLAHNLLTFHRANSRFIPVIVGELRWTKTRLGRKSAGINAVVTYLRGSQEWVNTGDIYDINDHLLPLAARVIKHLYSDVGGMLRVKKCPANAVVFGPYDPATLPCVPVIDREPTPYTAITLEERRESIRIVREFISQHPNPRHPLLRELRAHSTAFPECLAFMLRNLRERYKEGWFSPRSLWEHSRWHVRRAVLGKKKRFRLRDQLRALYCRVLVHAEPGSADRCEFRECKTDRILGFKAVQRG